MSFRPQKNPHRMPFYTHTHTTSQRSLLMQSCYLSPLLAFTGTGETTRAGDLRLGIWLRLCLERLWSQCTIFSVVLNFTFAVYKPCKTDLLQSVIQDGHVQSAHKSDVHYSWEDVHRCLFTPHREPGTEQSTDACKVLIGEPMSFLWLLTAWKTRQLYRQKPSPAWGTLGLSAWHSGRWTGWTVFDA